ncbi:alpha-1,3-glucosyltransferase [Parastagonospora nodorum]|nr:alpha-1,3-glucosyltransferase [Parastagonospora nodorum]KAH3992776.1 alpha-1,3-glucosyltransferase [Parastagonospora nodorum]KAH4029785.1 alpha-1,3-glucosyltransferase [Parastagonospora nodorum]KAH4115177.1 alpha-1,3-glucosyltransferase [Parastagonospora nodorum]KAH4403275.1 alpha-1,3-glucosyltransferase [Parastagonospora nodorum]
MAMASPAHKPRRRRKIEEGSLAHVNHGTLDLDESTNVRKPAFPLVAFLWPAKGTVSQWVTIPLVLMVVGLFRWTTSLWGYSGFQSLPMHGDFEAQRHWMEITKHLPVSQWYFYDLQWWGLDYPPLTAYHSWILGIIGSAINPEWFELYESRALDDPSLKVFMRATVFVSEYLAYIPAVVIFLRRYSRLEGVNIWEASIALVAILMQPATILIDHGHFQYNTVMLGFAVATMSSMIAGRPLWGCVFFVGALGFKQMALFYAPAVFAYLLGICLFPRINIVRFLAIALTTVAAFAVLYLPFMLGVAYDVYEGIAYDKLPLPPLMESLPMDWDAQDWYYPFALQLAQSVHRIFPFSRGLFEDKVANIWCTVHTFHKLHRYPIELLQRLALGATSAAILPPCLIIFFKPKRSLLPLAFAAVSWGFFLCSYQVHEKNVLLPLLPMTLLLSGKEGLLPSTRAWVGLANMLGVWTMYPLLKRDELRVPYFVISLLWAYLVGLPPVSFSAYHEGSRSGLNLISKILHLNIYMAMVGWHVAEAFFPPPADKPDLWIVANAIVGTGGFGLCYLWCLWRLIAKSELFGAAKSKTL